MTKASAQSLPILSKHSPAFQADVYAAIPQVDLVLFAVQFLQTEAETAATEEIVSTCFRLFPHSFALKNYFYWPDSALVTRRLHDAKEKGLLKGSPTEGFELKGKGRQLAKQTAKALGVSLPEAPKPVQPPVVEPVIEKKEEQPQEAPHPEPTAQPVEKVDVPAVEPTPEKQPAKKRSTRKKAETPAAKPEVEKKPVKKRVTRKKVEAPEAKPVEKKSTKKRAASKKAEQSAVKPRVKKAEPKVEKPQAKKQVTSKKVEQPAAKPEVKKAEPKVEKPQAKKQVTSKKAEKPTAKPEVKKAEPKVEKPQAKKQATSKKVEQPAAKPEVKQVPPTVEKKKERKKKEEQPTQLAMELAPATAWKKAEAPATKLKVKEEARPVTGEVMPAVAASKEEKDKAAKVIKMIERSDAYQLYRRNGRRAQIGEFDFRNMLFATMESSPETLKRNVELYKRYAGIHFRTDLVAFLEFCEEHFAELLKPKAKLKR